MKKQIACPVCEGTGHVVWINTTEDTCSAGCKICPHCDGTGTRMVDMTNADRIRDMSDEELAKYLLSISTAECPFSYEDCGEFKTCEECWNYWLHKPAKL